MDSSRLLNFSPDGRLFQIEYSLEAIKLGTNVIGIKNKSGGILLSEKKEEERLKQNRNVSKIITFNENIRIAISGLTSDARFLIEKILVFLENNLFVFNYIPSLENCAKKIRDFILFSHNEENKNWHGNRPFGIAFLIMGIYFSEINLFQINPMGESIPEKIAALGIGHKDAIFIIKEGYRKKMSTESIRILAFKTLKTVLKKEENKIKWEFVLLERKKKIFRTI
jgi:20S proteasome subunit alpha 5